MSNSSWYFFYQKVGGEEKWTLELASKRDEIVSSLQPAFVSVLDLSSVPDDNDWTKTRYKGPLYFDFDAEGDLDLACTQFISFLDKLATEVNFDLGQARFYASGGKGFHIEIPQECFMPKLPPAGTPWLAYVYRTVAEGLVVDTMDLNVYTGKRGRMWRTPGVERSNGNFKVPISLEEAYAVTPDLYAELISLPREVDPPTPPSCNSRFAMLFEQARDKVLTHMRGKKKRQASANALLDPWKKAKKHPPTIVGLMDGSLVAEGARFQSLAMQLAIYAASVEMPLDGFLAACEGLCEKHVGDSTRYRGVDKRRTELARMWRYMDENSLYDFDVGPLAKLATPGLAMADLGMAVVEDAPARTVTVNEDGEVVEGMPETDLHRSVRKGFFMSKQGMFLRKGDNVDSICRASLINVESFYDVEEGAFKGFEFDIVAPSTRTKRAMLGADAFTSASKVRAFLAAHQFSYQGGEPETAALFDVMSELANRGGRTYVFPREGFFVIDNPNIDKPTPVKVYLTQHEFLSSLDPDDENYFQLRYRPTQAISSYNIDLHQAPDLDDSMIPALEDMFGFTRDDIAADLLGWFVACQYRSLFLRLFNQFPILQVYGEAGSGKSQTVWMLAHMHWYMTTVSMKSATSCTPFAMDTHASSSTSAPFILDEYKPRELRMHRGKYEKLKDVLKQSYIGGDIGERGTINKGAENNLAVIRNRCTAPIVIMGEALEMETALIERSVCVNLSKTYQTEARRLAFNRLHGDPIALSALGKELVQAGFGLSLAEMKREVRDIEEEISEAMPDYEDEAHKRAAPRMIYNRAVIIYSLRLLKSVLHAKFGDHFDAAMDLLLDTRSTANATEQAQVMAVMSMSEVSKVLSRIALLSRDRGAVHEMVRGLDYIVGDNYVEIRVERAYDQYRRYCASINDTPLFDSVDSFTHALTSYSPCIDRHCMSSELRGSESSERVVRFDTQKLRKENVQSFRA